MSAAGAIAGRQRKCTTNDTRCMCLVGVGLHPSCGGLLRNMGQGRLRSASNSHLGPVITQSYCTNHLLCLHMHSSISIEDDIIIFKRCCAPFRNKVSPSHNEQDDSYMRAIGRVVVDIMCSVKRLEQLREKYATAVGEVR